MRQFFRRCLPQDPQFRANSLASLIAVGTVGFLYLQFPVEPAGAETIRLTRAAPKPLINLQAAAPVEAAPSAGTPSTSVAEILSPEQQAEATLQRKIAQLERGITFLKGIPSYSAQFTRQELVDGTLLDEQEMTLKVQHEPFSVYLKWHTGERGREAIYVAGQNDGEMLVHAGGWKARLGTLSIDPDGTLAMQENRHPITNAGILELAKMIVNYHQRDLQTHNYTRCEQLADAEFDGRACDVYLIEYKDQSASETYRKSLTFIDKERSVPLYIKNFGWPGANTQADGEELDEATLIEFYSFAEIDFGGRMVAADFDTANEEYGFKR